MKKVVIISILGGLGAAGYMYMKNNPNAVSNMKSMVKNMAKKTYDKLEDMDM